MTNRAASSPYPFPHAVRPSQRPNSPARPMRPISWPLSMAHTGRLFFRMRSTLLRASPKVKGYDVRSRLRRTSGSFVMRASAGASIMLNGRSVRRCEINVGTGLSADLMDRRMFHGAISANCEFLYRNWFSSGTLAEGCKMRIGNP